MEKPRYRFVWNPTNISRAAECLMQFYLISVEKKKPATTADMASGRFIHNAMSRFYVEDNGIRRPKYRSAEAFANAMKAQWVFAARNPGFRNRIEWKSREEPYWLGEHIWKVCRAAYDRYASEGPPEYSEYPIKFRLDGRTYNVRLDEIRKGLDGPVIRDLKSGRRKPGRMSLNYDPQFTLYSLAVACECFRKPEFAESIGVDPEEAKRWGGREVFIPDSFELQYYHMIDDEIIPVKKRSDMHYYEITGMIDNWEERINSGLVYPERGYKCDKCVVREPCDQRFLSMDTPARSHVQLDFFRNVPFLRKPERKKGKQMGLFSRTAKSRKA